MQLKCTAIALFNVNWLCRDDVCLSLTRCLRDTPRLQSVTALLVHAWEKRSSVLVAHNQLIAGLVLNEILGDIISEGSPPAGYVPDMPWCIMRMMLERSSSGRVGLRVCLSLCSRASRLKVKATMGNFVV